MKKFIVSALILVVVCSLIIVMCLHIHLRNSLRVPDSLLYLNRCRDTLGKSDCYLDFLKKHQLEPPVWTYHQSDKCVVVKFKSRKNISDSIRNDAFIEMNKEIEKAEKTNRTEFKIKFELGDDNQ